MNLYNASFPAKIVFEVRMTKPGEALPLGCTGRVHVKGVAFSRWKYIKGSGIHAGCIYSSLRGRLSCIDLSVVRGIQRRT